MSGNYSSVHVEDCLSRRHSFTTAWSDKNPKKVSLICQTCSLATHTSAYAAYGVDTEGFGPWKSKRVAAAAAAGPLERMHVSFGIITNETCFHCAHYQKLDIGARCGIYQRTHRSSFWLADGIACGKFETP